MSTEQLVRKHIMRVLDVDVDSDVDLAKSLFNDYSLTSLNMVVMMTSICEEANVDLVNFSQQDILSIQTGLDVKNMIDSKRA